FNSIFLVTKRITSRLSRGRNLAMFSKTSGGIASCGHPGLVDRSNMLTLAAREWLVGMFSSFATAICCSWKLSCWREMRRYPIVQKRLTISLSQDRDSETEEGPRG